MMNKKLYRSRTQKMLAGVCGGLAEYLNIDVTLVRLICALAFIRSLGVAMVVYIVAAIAMPVGSYERGGETIVVDEKGPVDSTKGMLIIGLILIGMGILAFLKVLIPDVWGLIRKGFFPTLLIAVGIFFMYTSWTNKENK